MNLKKCKNVTCYSDATCRDGCCPTHTKNVKKKLGYNKGKTKPKTSEIHLGVEVECFASSDNAHTAMLSQWKTPCADGSLPDMGCEFKFCYPIKNALAWIPRFTRRLEEVGASVNHKCGMHVHLDARFASGDRISTFLKFLESFQDWWFSIMPSSRSNNHYVAKLPCFSRYGWATRTNYGTVEIRLHGGTLSPYKVHGWLSVCADLAELLNSTAELPTLEMVEGKPTVEFLKKVFKRPEALNYLLARQASNGSLRSTSATSNGIREEVA